MTFSKLLVGDYLLLQNFIGTWPCVVVNAGGSGDTRRV